MKTKQLLSNYFIELNKLLNNKLPNTNLYKPICYIFRTILLSLYCVLRHPLVYLQYYLYNYCFAVAVVIVVGQKAPEMEATKIPK